MSPASRAFSRLRKQYRNVLTHVRKANSRRSVSPLLEALEARLLLSSDTQLIGLDLVRSTWPSLTGAGQTVVVIDTGINYNHPGFSGNIWTNPGEIAGNSIDDDGNGYVDDVHGYDFVNDDGDPLDLDGHGTNVAGIIASSGSDAPGVASGAKVIALKALPADSESSAPGAIADALQWVIDNREAFNITAVNLSLRSQLGNFTSVPSLFGLFPDWFTGGEESKLETLDNAGVFVCAAAGNDFFTYGSQQGLAYPAISPHAADVGAVWSSDQGGPVNWLSGAMDNTTGQDYLCSFSQRWSGMDILAPGGEIKSLGLGTNPANPSTYYDTRSGTSQATPFVTGASMLVRQALHDFMGVDVTSKDRIIQILKDSADDVTDSAGNPDHDNVANTDLVFNRLNVYKAIDLVWDRSLHVDEIVPLGAPTTPFDMVEVRFSQAIDDSTLSLADVSVNGPGGMITPRGISRVDSDTYRLDLTGLTGSGIYSVEVGPYVKNLAGEWMNQDRDDTTGEAGEDVAKVWLFSQSMSIGSSNLAYDGAGLVTYGRALTIDGTHQFQSLGVYGGGVVKHSAGVSIGLQLTILDNTTIDSLSSISADGSGYGDRSGPGAGQSSWPSPGYYVGGGAGFGGAGGNGIYYVCRQYGSNESVSVGGGSGYGSVGEPHDLGSGGGVVGGSGGGVIELNVGGSLLLDGAVSANGTGGSGFGGGGGSGGSVLLTAGNLEGKGTVKANGGNAASWHYSGSGYYMDIVGGGGGGGRIAIYCVDDSFTGTVTAYGGTGYQAGGAGTVYRKGGDSHAALVIDNAGQSGPTTVVSGISAFGQLTIQNAASVDVQGTGVTVEMLTVGNGVVQLSGSQVQIGDGVVNAGGSLTFNGAVGALTVNNAGTVYLSGISTAGSVMVGLGGVLTAVASTAFDLSLSGDITVGGIVKPASGMALHLAISGNMTVNSGAQILADGLGYGGNGGPGAGQTTSVIGGGGGYGGSGGKGSLRDVWFSSTTWTFANGGITYGLVDGPTDLGSGGGWSDGAGGGAIRLEVGGTLSVEGSVRANGFSGTNQGSGGGSGGSIWLTAGTLEGNGSITANGGNGNYTFHNHAWYDQETYYGGGGGGGRIAITYAYDSFTGTITATGGTGDQAGGAGTIYRKAAGLTIERTGALVTSWNPLAKAYDLSSSAWAAEGGIVLGPGLDASMPLYRFYLPPPTMAAGELTSITISVYGKGDVGTWEPHLLLGSSSARVDAGAVPEEEGWHAYTYTGADARSLLAPIGGGYSGSMLDVVLDADWADWYDLKEIHVSYEYSGVKPQWLRAYQASVGGASSIASFDQTVGVKWDGADLQHDTMEEGIQKAASFAMSLLDLDTDSFFDALKAFKASLKEFRDLVDIMTSGFNWFAFWTTPAMATSPTIRTPLQNASSSLGNVAEGWLTAMSDGTITTAEAVSVNLKIDTAISSLSSLEATLTDVRGHIQLELSDGDPAMVDCAKVALQSLSPLMRFDPNTGANLPDSYVPALREKLGNQRIKLSPTDISLSPSAVAENQPDGTLVGTLSASDPNPADNFTYVLATGTGDTDNGSFTISGNQLKTIGSFDYEARSSYSIRVRTTDQGGLWYEEPFTINVTNVNEQPMDIALSNNSVAENQPVGTVVGVLSGTDPDAGQSATLAFTLVPGYGDNAQFSIDPATKQLKTGAVFDYESKSSYNIKIQATDTGSPVLTYDEVFMIGVVNVVEQAPVIVGISNDTGTPSDGITSDRTLLVSGTSEPGMTITVYCGGSQIGTTTANGSGDWTFNYTGTSLADGQYTFTATAKDTLNNVSGLSAPYNVAVDGTAPAVNGVLINGGMVQRTMITSLSVDFNEAVVCAAGALTLTNVTTSQQSNLSGVPFNAITHTWDISGVALTDGHYTARLSAGAVEDLAGNPMSEDYTFIFQKLAGDTTGDGSVDAEDYITLKCGFGRVGGAAWDSGDLDGDGDVDWSDLQRLMGSFGAREAAPAAVPATPKLTPAEPAQAGVTELTESPMATAPAPVADTVAELALLTAPVADVAAEPALLTAPVADAVAEPELLPTPVANVPEADILAIAAGILGNRLAAGRQNVPVMVAWPANSSPPARMAVRVGPLSIATSSTSTSSTSPLLNRGTAGQAVADVLQLAGPWWSGDSARHELPDEPWMTRLAVDITGKPRKGRLDPIGLDVLAVRR